ncbi:ABC transporter ATP-binding protein [Altererythrobacter sp. B11]|uniref:ATP-binding cassette domain-containing protein n=1 Tax=Altererythrobacter sp. B11 TaxID=2060312 RepID=UPI000DC7333E|nr:ATP-binding cassette domain-containing protein [Altererythrobacter sp. B11]BBC71156.1 ABC transporter ATP-binding protein [Altererythrobacter sp. B11]
MTGGRAPFLRFEQVCKSFGGTRAVAGVTLDVPKNAFVALVGASGSGKSTLLKTVNRLAEPDTGRVLLEGEDVSAAPPVQLRRRIGYVFQGIGLFPHLTVAENIGIGPRIRGQRASRERIAELLRLVDLDPGVAERAPAALSGGQRQRVGVARALAAGPHLLLMDEPFGALDPVTRDAIGRRVRDLHDRLGLTTIMVTHDMAEALLLADRVVVLDAGRIAADATPAELLGGAGGDVAQALVAVPREQARALAGLGG